MTDETRNQPDAIENLPPASPEQGSAAEQDSVKGGSTLASPTTSSLADAKLVQPIKSLGDIALSCI